MRVVCFAYIQTFLALCTHHKNTDRQQPAAAAAARRRQVVAGRGVHEAVRLAGDVPR